MESAASVEPAGLYIGDPADADALLNRIRASAQRAHDWIAAQAGDPLDMLKRMKFEPVGFHPIEDRALNVVEQINQTWTYFVASWQRQPRSGCWRCTRMSAGSSWRLERTPRSSSTL